MNDKRETYFVEGSRVCLREVRLSDVGEAYHRWMNDPEVTRFLESRFYPNSLEGIGDFVHAMQKDKDNVFFAIVLKEGRHIGNIKVGPINWIHRFADVGLLLGEKDCWGKGYATEAIALVTSYAFKTMNLHRLCAGCYDANQGSAKAFLKAGWQQEGLRKSHFFSGGAYCDEILLGVVRPG